MSDIVERLAPCPFCGGRAEIYGGLFPPLGPRYGVTCRGECKTFLDCRCVHQAEAIAAWNRRSDATITALREEVAQARKAAAEALYGEGNDPGYPLPEMIEALKVLAQNGITLTALRQRVKDVAGQIIAALDARQTLLSTSAPVRALAALQYELADDEKALFDNADWYWRTMDPDDSGDHPSEALNRGMVGNFTVCEVASSFTGPTRYGFTAPVLDPESDDEEFLHFATQEEAMIAAGERLAAIKKLKGDTPNGQ